MSDINKHLLTIRDNLQSVKQEVIDDIDEATRSAGEMEDHQNQNNNPHDLSKADVDLGSMHNYPVANELETITALTTERYLQVSKLPLTYDLLVFGGGEIPPIRTPGIISPRDGLHTPSRLVTLKAGPYGGIYDQSNVVIGRKHREFQVDVQEGDFTSPMFAFSLDRDDYSFADKLPVNTTYIWRCRDIDLLDNAGDWSEIATFKTPAGEWQPPHISVTGETGIFKIHVSDVQVILPESFPHEKTEIEVSYSEEFDDLVLSFTESTTITSLTLATLLDEKDVYVRCRVTGGGLAYSDWSNVLSFNTGISEANLFEFENSHNVHIVDGTATAIAGSARNVKTYPYICTRDADKGTMVYSRTIVHDTLENYSVKRLAEFNEGYLCSVGPIDSSMGEYLVRLNKDLEITWSCKMPNGIHDLAATATGLNFIITSKDDQDNLIITSMELDTGLVIKSKQYNFGPCQFGNNSITLDTVSGNFYIFGQATEIKDELTHDGDRSIFYDVLDSDLEPVGDLHFMTVDGAKMIDLAVIEDVPVLFIETPQGVIAGTFNNDTWVRINDPTVTLNSCIVLDNTSIFCTGMSEDKALVIQAQVVNNRIAGFNWGYVIDNAVDMSGAFRRNDRFEFAARSHIDPKIAYVFSVQSGSSYDIVPSKSEIIFTEYIAPYAETSRKRAKRLSEWSEWVNVPLISTPETNTSSPPPLSEIEVPPNTRIAEYKDEEWVENGTYIAYSDWPDWEILELGDSKETTSATPPPTGTISVPPNTDLVEYNDVRWIEEETYVDYGEWSAWAWVDGNYAVNASTPSNDQMQKPDDTDSAEYRGGEWTDLGITISKYDDIRDTGYLGVVPVNQAFTGPELASLLGMTESWSENGTPVNDDTPWVGFYVGPNATCNKEGGVPYLLYTPQKVHRIAISWTYLNEVGAVSGNKTVSKAGQTYKVRLFSGGNTKSSESNYSNTNDYNHPLRSEWNQLMYRIDNFYPVGGGDDSGGGQVGSDWAYVTSGMGGGQPGTWCMEAWHDNSGLRVLRGLGSIDKVSYASTGILSTDHGWRAVLIRTLG